MRLSRILASLAFPRARKWGAGIPLHYEGPIEGAEEAALSETAGDGVSAAGGASAAGAGAGFFLTGRFLAALLAFFFIAFLAFLFFAKNKFTEIMFGL